MFSDRIWSSGRQLYHATLDILRFVDLTKYSTAVYLKLLTRPEI
jgi:hypothetical protein